MLEIIAENHYRLHGELNMKNSAELMTELFAVINDSKNSRNQMQLDFSGIKSPDSVLLACIIHVARIMEAKNGVLRVTGFPDKLRGLARTYGVDALIDHYMVVS